MGKTNACCIPSCGKKRGSNPLSYFLFPKSLERKDEWCKLLQLDKENVSPWSQVCELHFKGNSFTDSKRCRLGKNAVPFRSEAEQNESEAPSQVATSARVNHPLRSNNGNIEQGRIRIQGTQSTSLRQVTVSSPCSPVPQPVTCRPIERFSIFHPILRKTDSRVVGASSRPSAAARRRTSQSEGLQKLRIQGTQSTSLSQETLSSPYSPVPQPVACRPNERFSNFCPILPKTTQDSKAVQVSTPSAAATPRTCQSERLQKLRIKQISRKVKRDKIQKDMEIERIITETFQGKRNETLRKLIHMQISRHSSKKNKAYSFEEKVLSMTIYYNTTKQSYKFLQQIGLKLPSTRSVRYWLENLNVGAGINQNLITVIQESVDKMTSYEKDAVMMMDEMAIKQYVQYDKPSDSIDGIVDHGYGKRNLGVANHANVILLRGLNSNWVFPLAYYFSEGNTRSMEFKDMVDECLDVVSRIGLKVRAFVCDQGFTNQGLYNILGVTVSEPYFYFREKKIYAIYDTPHIIKNIRNHLKKHGYFVDGQHVVWKDLVKLYEIDSMSDNSMVPKLTKYHLEIPDCSKMKVKFATQLLSRSVAAAIKTLVQLPEFVKTLEDGKEKIIENTRKMRPESIGLANFVEKINDIFDILNVSRRLVPGQKMKSGLYIFENVTKLHDAYRWVCTWMMSDGAAIPDSVRGLKQTLLGVRSLILDLKHEGYQFVLTRRIQQDILEHFFAFQRGTQGFCQNPTTKQFRQGFKYAILNGIFRNKVGTNCEIHDKVFPLAQFSERIRTLLQLPRNPTVSLPQQCVSQPAGSECESSDEFEESGDDSNDEFRTDFSALDFFDLMQNDCFDLFDRNVAVYMMNWSVKYITKKTKCDQCKNMLEFPYTDREDPGENWEETLLFNKSYTGDNMYSGVELSYGHIVKEKYQEVFFKIFQLFRIACIYHINDQGVNVCKIIYKTIRRDTLVSNWIEDEPTCLEHRQKMVKLIITAKTCKLIRKVNMRYRQPKSFRQTREDLRHQ